jgi:hypothetical protein
MNPTYYSDNYDPGAYVAESAPEYDPDYLLDWAREDWDD